MQFIYTDSEAYSEADIEDGAPLYAEHPSTDVLVWAFAVGDSEPDTDLVYYAGKDRDGFWYTNIQDYGMYADMPAQILYDHAENPESLFVAHNAAFEMYMWRNHMVRRYGFPDIPDERWIDTMAMAYAHGLPGSLGDCAEALELEHKKDKRGKELISKLCKPQTREKGRRHTPDSAPQDFLDLYSYCADDIRATRDIHKKLRPLSKLERRVWLIDRRINQEGLHLDRPLVEKANEIRLIEQKEAIEKFDAITGLRPTQTAKIKEWLHKEGFEVPNTGKHTLLGLIRSKHTPDYIREACEIRVDANMNSLAKYGRALEITRPLSASRLWLREWARYSAAHTTRWTSGDMQLHNMMRPKCDTDLCAAILNTYDIDDFYWFYGGSINPALGSTVRGSIIPPEDKEFYVADFAQIESRVLAWLAGEEWKLEDYRNKKDVYSILATTIWGRTITKEDKEDRQVGKVGDLSLGYGGGIRAFANMAKQYDCDIAPIYVPMWQSATGKERDEAVRHYKIYLKQYKPELNNGEPAVSPEVGYTSNIIKERWRKKHPRVAGVLNDKNEVVKDGYWQKLEKAAIDAIITGKPHTVCMGAPNTAVTYFMDRQFLYAKMPSGGTVIYPYPKVRVKKGGGRDWSYMKMDKGQWVRRSTYGGSQCENNVQKVARDLLVAAMIRLEEIFPVCLHVHDELVSAVDKNIRRRYDAIKEFENIVAKLPKWADGIPMAVDAFTCERYRK